MIISLESEPLKTLLYSTDLSEAEKETIPIKDVDPNGFHLLLEFLYKKHLKLRNLTATALESVLYLSQQFLATSLTKAIEDLMEKTLFSDNKLEDSDVNEDEDETEEEEEEEQEEEEGDKDLETNNDDEEEEEEEDSL